LFRWREPVGGLGCAVTSRAGGASHGPYSSLNLADHVGDNPVDVARNRVLVAAALGVDHVVTATQVHGATVAVVDEGWSREPVEADALVTRLPGRALAVLVADCTPVMLLAPDEGVVAVAHAGRAGLVAGVVGATVAVMRRLGARRVVARVGPGICGGCYEVPAAMRDEVGSAVPAAVCATRQGKPGLDIAAGVVAQLADAGTEVRRLRGCACEDDDLFSFRRDGVTGRYAGLAWLNE
jgi:YfiH family protein